MLHHHQPPRPGHAGAPTASPCCNWRSVKGEEMKVSYEVSGLQDVSSQIRAEGMR